MSDHLSQINSPEDVRKLSSKEVVELAEELRDYMLETISRSGGHLGSNLGTVELTLALHRAFDFRRDKLLWDVGHQCYTHKIITGRREPFTRLREADGVSGFPQPVESEYDQFTVGHAGTAVPTALGTALGLQQNGGDEKVIALVGDASIVNGVSFEGLNNLGLVKRQLLIILNDNSMAIDPTQGAVSKLLSKIRLSHTYEDLRRTSHAILEHTPVIGKTVDEAIERIKKHIRMVMPGSQLFESLNIPYFGPVDGHDIETLTELFKALKELKHPAILHVLTKKGKGFGPAEEAKGKFHSTPPFKINGCSTETTSQKKRTYTNAFGDALLSLAQKDDSIVAITSAMCDGTGLGKFREEFPNRFYDVGIAESAAVDIAAGMAKEGLKPVVCIYSTFLNRSFDQIFQEVSLQHLPVTFCIDRAGLVGNDGPTHHGTMDIGFLRMMPNTIVAAPSCGAEMEAALRFAVHSETSVCLRYPKEAVPDSQFDEKILDTCTTPFELGKSVCVRETDAPAATIIAYGCVLKQCIEAADELAKDDIEVDVINARFAAPIDEALVSVVLGGKPVVTVEDHAVNGGFGAALQEAVCEKHSDIPVRIQMMGIPREFVAHDTRGAQLKRCGLDADSIAQRVRAVVGCSKIT